MLDSELFEEIAMKIIANAGGARSCAFNAIARARENDFEAAACAMEEARRYSLDAHNAHSRLLELDAKGELESPDILLTHAQDHFMTAQLSLDLAAEIVEVYRKLNGGV